MIRDLLFGDSGLLFGHVVTEAIPSWCQPEEEAIDIQLRLLGLGARLPHPLDGELSFSGLEDFGVAIQPDAARCDEEGFAMGSDVRATRPATDAGSSWMTPIPTASRSKRKWSASATTLGLGGSMV